jgi:hypothetical protein
VFVVMVTSEARNNAQSNAAFTAPVDYFCVFLVQCKLRTCVFDVASSATPSRRKGTRSKRQRQLWFASGGPRDVTQWRNAFQFYGRIESLPGQQQRQYIVSYAIFGQQAACAVIWLCLKVGAKVECMVLRWLITDAAAKRVYTSLAL